MTDWGETLLNANCKHCSHIYRDHEVGWDNDKFYIICKMCSCTSHKISAL